MLVGFVFVSCWLIHYFLFFLFFVLHTVFVPKIVLHCMYCNCMNIYSIFILKVAIKYCDSLTLCYFKWFYWLLYYLLLWSLFLYIIYRCIEFYRLSNNPHPNLSLVLLHLHICRNDLVPQWIAKHKNTLFAHNSAHTSVTLCALSWFVIRFPFCCPPPLETVFQI